MFFLSDDPLFSDEELLLMCAASVGKTVEDTATGNPLTFTTDIAKPLKSLLIPFTPIQQGTGDPSPQNIRPILPWDGLNVWHGGKNITEILKNAPRGTFEGFSFKHKIDFKVKPNTDYTLSSTSTGAMNVLYFNGVNSQSVGVNASNPRTQNSGSSGILSVMLYDRDNIADYENGTIKVQLEEGSTATTIDQYEGTTYPVTFPSPVYGGTLDVVSGVLTVTMAGRIYDGTEQGWSSLQTEVTTRGIAWEAVRGATLDGNRVIACNWLKPSNATQDEAPLYGIENSTQTRNIRVHISENGLSYADFQSALRSNPLLVVCPLVTPQTVQLTPQQITAIVGDNTIWSDADGSMTAVYLKKGRTDAV